MVQYRNRVPCCVHVFGMILQPYWVEYFFLKYYIIMTHQWSLFFFFFLSCTGYWSIHVYQRGSAASDWKTMNIEAIDFWDTRWQLSELYIIFTWVTMRDFSSRYSRVRAPTMDPLKIENILIFTSNSVQFTWKISDLMPSQFHFHFNHVID